MPLIALLLSCPLPLGNLACCVAALAAYLDDVVALLYILAADPAALVEPPLALLYGAVGLAGALLGALPGFFADPLHAVALLAAGPLGDLAALLAALVAPIHHVLWCLQAPRGALALALALAPAHPATRAWLSARLSAWLAACCAWSPALGRLCELAHRLSAAACRVVDRLGGCLAAAAACAGSAARALALLLRALHTACVRLAAWLGCDQATAEAHAAHAQRMVVALLLLGVAGTARRWCDAALAGAGPATWAASARRAAALGAAAVLEPLRRQAGLAGTPPARALDPAVSTAGEDLAAPAADVARAAGQDGAGLGDAWGAALLGGGLAGLAAWLRRRWRR